MIIALPVGHLQLLLDKVKPFRHVLHVAAAVVQVAQLVTLHVPQELVPLLLPVLHVVQPANVLLVQTAH